MKTRREILNGFNAYLAKYNGKEPDAAICSIVFYGAEGDTEVIVKLNCEVEDPFDDKFFFYCKHIEGLFSILGEDSDYEDFYVKEVYEFIDSKEYFS